MKPIGYNGNQGERIMLESNIVATDETIALPTDAEAPDLPVVSEQFVVHDASSASWVARKVNEARAYAKRVSEWAAREIKRAERDEQFLMMRYGGQLEEWASQQIALLKGRRRSICLPGGTVGYRM